MKKNFYAEQAIWGADIHEIKTFETKAARDEYVRTHDYSNAIPAKLVNKNYRINRYA